MQYMRQQTSQNQTEKQCLKSVDVDRPSKHSKG